jgi:hypothetical protein
MTEGGRMNDRDWKDSEHGCLYYYKIENGQIIGQVYNLAHTKVWCAKTIHENEERHLGQYINADFAQMALERYWNVKDRTLLEN